MCLYHIDKVVFIRTEDKVKKDIKEEEHISEMH